MPETDSDVSADTTRFQAFKDRRDDDLPPAWQMKASGSKIGVFAAVVIVVAVLAAIVGVLLVG